MFVFAFAFEKFLHLILNWDKWEVLLPWYRELCENILSLFSLLLNQEIFKGFQEKT